MKNDFPLGKFLFELNKPKAKTTYKIYEDRDDPWFLYVVKIDIKTGKSSRTSMIIQKDLEGYVDSLKGEGWQKSENQ
jgi:hypothetical protein